MLSREEIKQTIEQFSEALVLAEPGDLPTLARMHTQCTAMAVWAEESGYAAGHKALIRAAELLEGIILSEVPDPVKALTLVGQGVSALAEIARDGREEREVTFPAELLSQGEWANVLPAPVAANAIPAPDSVFAMPLEESQEEGSGPMPLEGDLSLIGEFVSEAKEHLENADLHLLTLETDPHGPEALNAVFRAFHTIKGVAGFLALADIQKLAHEAENLLDKARKGELTFEGPCVDAAFEAVDMLKRLIDGVADCLASGGMLMPEPGLGGLLGRIRHAMRGGGSAEPEKKRALAEPGQKLGEVLIDSGLVAPETVAAAIKTQQEELEPDKLGELLLAHVLVSRAQLDEALALQKQEGGRRKLGEILVELGAVRQSDLDTVMAQQRKAEPPRLGEVLVKSGEVEARDVAAGLRAQQQQRQSVVKEPAKVDADRLDRLVDLIGELVISESMVSQSNELSQMASPPLLRQVGQLDKITRELQEIGTSLRMVPVRGTFQKMARLARDVAKKANKKVDFVTVGDDTELDKTVVDKIGDPLVHMVRNAVDHGIESDGAARVAKGKPEVGRVELRAFHKGGSIYIEIEDDGRGLNREAILAKAKERGLIHEGDTLSDREIFSLIFEPGFSTAKEITDVSGRGVGMDVVRRNIEALRGQIEIQSEDGYGSIFSIRLPLTLAIIDGMVVRVGQERYIIPTLSIVRSIRPEQANLFTVVKRGEMLSLQGELIPMFRMGTLFKIPGAITDPTQALVVVVEDEGKQAGILTDELLGEQQIVIKSLGESMQGIQGISGGAIMSDGRVGLIVDVGGLVRLANAE